MGFVNCKPSGSPHTIASISAPATEMMAQDNWTDMHTAGTNVPRWNMVFADGHAKFTRWVDSNIPNQAQRPWAWDYCNPQSPVNIEAPCSPDCKTVAGQ